MKISSHTKVLGMFGAGLALWAAIASPAAHAANSTTATTFTVSGGALGVSAPGSKALATVATTSSEISAQLGTVTVSDLRGALLGSWTASVSSSAFLNTTTNGGTADETISTSQVSYWSGAASTSSGVGVFAPGQLTVLQAQTLASSRTAFSATAVIGNNTIAWNPTVVVAVPSDVVAGTYSGTVTHSVA